MPSLPRKSPVQSDRVAYFSTVVPGLDFNRRQHTALERAWVASRDFIRESML